MTALKPRTKSLSRPQGHRGSRDTAFRGFVGCRGSGGIVLGGSKTGRRTSHLEFDADFHYLHAGNLEIGARPLRVVMHEGEQLLAPARHAGPASGSDDRLVPGVVRHVARVALSDLAARHCE